MKRLTRRELLAMGRDVSAGLAAGALLPLTGCHHRMEQQSSTRVIVPGLTPLGEGSLKAHALDANLLSGSAVDVHALRMDGRYRGLVAEQCSIIVAENAMKWAALRPAPDVFEFADADYLVDFAEKNDIKLRGHNLVWHLALPSWFKDTVFKGNAQKMLTEHIATVAGRYAGRIHSWDVVNEAIDVNDQRPDGLRKTVWLELIGEDYIEVAFRAARQADPSALLTYNEYGIERDNYASDQKRAQVLLLLRRLKARNVPIDAVGIQSHLPAEALNTSGNYLGVAHFIAEVRAMGLQVFITEMDVSDSAIQGDQRERNRAVAATYSDYLHVVLADPAVKAVLTWGLSGSHSWLNHEQPRVDHSALQPLPFDGEYKTLPAFFAMREAFDGRLASLKNPPAAAVDPWAPFTPRPKTAAKPDDKTPAVKKPVPAPASTLPAMPTTQKN
jgi:endo-1,4-beta-xylanase